MQFGMIGWYVPLSMYPAGYGENPNVPRSIRDPLWQLFSFPFSVFSVSVFQNFSLGAKKSAVKKAKQKK